VVLFSHVLATQVIDWKWKKLLHCRKENLQAIKLKKKASSLELLLLIKRF